MHLPAIRATIHSTSETAEAATSGSLRIDFFSIFDGPQFSDEPTRLRTRRQA
jgi:hypothetical protein